MSRDDNDNDNGLDPDVFDIPSKEAEPEALLKWRQATLVLNATRRFRYTAKVQTDGPPTPDAKKAAAATKFRTSGHALMAVNRFKEAGARRQKPAHHPDDFGDEFGLTVEQLLDIQGEADLAKLNEKGGVPYVCRALRVNPDKGISGTPDDMTRRKEKYGANTYPEQPQKSFFMFAWEACQDLTLIILMACAAVSLVAGMITDGPAEGWYDGVAIGAAVIIVILVTATSDYRQSLQFRGLNAEKSNIQLKVLRGERMQTVSIFTLVVGDIIPLATGDQVPADGLLISGHSLTIDESSMTGESDPLHKDAKHPFLLSGCKVVDGFGTMVATAVGTNTEWGRIMATVNTDDDSETPLQVRLNGLATAIGKLGLVCAVIVLIVELVRYFVLDFYVGLPASQVVKDLVDILTISVTIIVVAVPEGLPLAVTLTLAYSMHKMMADKALVRHLAACETMGSATTICSDKTGTLTLNQMTVVQEWQGGAVHETEAKELINPTIKDLLFEGIALNSTASVFIPPDGGEPEVTTSPTEAAVTKWALSLGMKFSELRERIKTLSLETFNSTKKVGGACVKRPDGAVAVHWKGAAEIIVDRCTKVMDSNGNAVDLDEAQKAKALEAISSMAVHSLRCIGLATAVVPPGDVPQETEEWKFPDTELTLLAILGIKDPCRPGVPDAVARCQKAGVKVRMVTGDNVNTARAIAGECGILTPNGRVVEGKDFRVMTKEQVLEMLPSLDVMARSSPSDKYLLVKALRSQGEVVAVTGDGTNDGPALHEADIGLSMGLSGTEVAKESSDIVILDDNFTSIVKVVRWGRSVFANIQKFVQFQLTVNVVALSINLISAISSGDIPLNAVQLLWVNLIMDTLGALALATEPPTDDLLLQTPVGRKAPLITNIMWRNIFGQAAFQLTVLLILNYDGINLLNLSGYSNPTRVNNTIIFNTFVLCQIFNEINARHPVKLNVFKGLHNNPLFIFVIIISCGFQFIIVELLHDFAKTTSLTWQQWLFCVVVGSISLPLAFVLKFIPVTKTPLFDFTKKIRIFRRRKGPSTPRSGSQATGNGTTNDDETAYEEANSTSCLVNLTRQRSDKEEAPAAAGAATDATAASKAAS